MSATTPSSEVSVLRELKEIIAKQADEIKELKSTLQASKSSTPSRPTSTQNDSHHHASLSAASSDSNQYLSTPFYTLAVRRVYWLAIFLISLSLTAIIMNEFESTLSKQIELAYFVPLLAGHGGNTGGQTIGSVLSALSTKSITSSDAGSIIRKEVSSGLTVGIILGVLVGFMAYLVGGISVHVSVVVGCTLPILSGVAGFLASGIPFLCVALGLDPAVIAAPAMTTFVDVSGLTSYFFIAGRVFRWFGVEF